MITDHYGGSTDRTFLRFFSMRQGEEVVHRELADADAYDTWHLAFYLKELLGTRALAKDGNLHVSAIPRKEKNLLVYLMLAANRDIRQVTEIGSSLFELIDGLELSRQCLPSLPVDVDSLHFLGIELSELLINATKELYPSFTVDFVRTVADVKGPLGLLYDRNVSSYAFETAAEFADFVNRSEIALLNAFFSYEKTFSSRRLGKRLTYFSLEEFASRLNKPLFHLFGTRAPGPKSGQDLSEGKPVIEGFFFVGPQDRAERTLELKNSDPAVAEWFDEKSIKLSPL